MNPLAARLVPDRPVVGTPMLVDTDSPVPERGYVISGENLGVLERLPPSSFQLIYIDPPFNTGSPRTKRTIATTRSDNGDRTGFGGNTYETTTLGTISYPDTFTDFTGFLAPRLALARRLLTPDGTLYLHIGQDESHYCKVLLDSIFGRGRFLNEIIWAYDFGGRSRRRWPAKHDTIFAYVAEPGAHYFDQDAVDRIPYMAPGLVTPEKALRGKMPTDVWWHTIVPTNSKEKTGYPTQKPEGILTRIVQASSSPGSWVLDFFAGSGTCGAVAARAGRRFVMVDESPEALATMRERLGVHGVVYIDSSGSPLTVQDRVRRRRLPAPDGGRAP